MQIGAPAVRHRTYNRQVFYRDHRGKTDMFVASAQEEPKFLRWRREIDRLAARGEMPNRKIYNSIEGRETDLLTAFEDLGAKLRVCSSWLITASDM